MSNGQGETIRPKEQFLEFLNVIGGRTYPSELDREGVRKFYALMPIPISPVQGATVRAPGDVELIWSGFPSAVEYQVQIATDTSFQSIVVDDYVGNIDAKRPMIENQSLTWDLPNISKTYYWRTRSVLEDGAQTWSGVESFRVSGNISAFRIWQNYPNPADNSTRFPFDLRNAARVQLSIMDITGRLVADVFEAEYSAGSHSITVNTRALASGTYLYRVMAGGESIIKMMIVAHGDR